MPPAKTRITIMVDIDIAQHYEEKYNAEVVRNAQAKKRIPSFSSYMNVLLRKYMEMEKTRKVNHSQDFT